LLDEIRFYEVELREVIKRLRRFFEHSDYDIVVLFGSILRVNIVRDIDIAIYSMRRDIELDEILELSYRLEEYLKIPVDIVPLSKAPPHIRLEILRKGIPIIVKVSSLYSELLKQSMEEVRAMELLLGSERKT